MLKLSPRSGDEHLSLARLQHTHIVPLYLVQDFPHEHVRALCMPYVGGTSLCMFSIACATSRPARRTGQHFVEFISAMPESAAQATNIASPVLRFLAKSNYIEAACWIGACLADALHYAHQRGLVHLDIKPSNVLLAGDGQPMLLDFHLAQEVIPAGTEVVQRLGGTPGTCRRNKCARPRSVREGRAIEQTVDGRSDIYALGIVLYELLVGRLPPDDEAARHRLLRERNPAVSRSLEDLVCKCLARDPAARYRDAARWRPTCAGTWPGCRCEAFPIAAGDAWQKWRRRRPHAAGVNQYGGGLVVHHREPGGHVSGGHAARGPAALALGQQQLDHHDYWPPSRSLKLARRPSPGCPVRKPKASLDSRLQFACARETRRQSPHAGGAVSAMWTDLPMCQSGSSKRLDAGCRAIWQKREQILRAADGSDDQQLKLPLRTDLLDSGAIVG